MAKVLILEPDESLAAKLSGAIQQEGLSTHIVPEIQDAMTGFRDLVPSLVLLDLEFNDAEGLRFCHTLRETPGGEMVPIVMMGTGKEAVRNFADALAQGGDYYFSKPVDIGKVVSKVLTYMGTDREEPAPTTIPKAAPLETPEGKKPQADLSQRVEQMIGLGKAAKDGLLIASLGQEKEVSQPAVPPLLGESGSKSDEVVLPQPPVEQEEAAFTGEDENTDDMFSRIITEEVAVRPGPTSAAIEVEPMVRSELGEEVEVVARREAEEQAHRKAEERTRREAEERARLEAKERARLEAKERARLEAEERTRREAEERARLEAKERARLEAKERARREAEERARLEAEERTRREAEERARLEAEERTRREAEERARLEAEERARLEAKERARLEAEERARLEAEEQTRREAEERTRLEVEERARREAEERTRLEVEERARREAEERARLEAEERARQEAEERAQAEEAAEGLQPPVPEGDLRVPTMLAREELVELLKQEATLAHEQVLSEPGSYPEDRIATRPGLPSQPEGQSPTTHVVVGEGDAFKEDSIQEGVFLREEAVDLQPRAFPQAGVGQGSGRVETPPRPDLRRVLRTEAPEAGDRIRGVAVSGSEMGAVREEGPISPAILPPFMTPNPEQTDLSRETVPALLWRLYTQEVTGAVTLRSGGDTKLVFFEGGVPVGIRSSQTADRLEEVLYREGLIDRAAYAEARIKGIPQPRALAAHLVERGLLKPDELFPLVRRHLEDCLLGVFEWVEGTAAYSEGYALDAEKVRLARPMASLVLEGIRRKFLMERMVRELGGPSSLLAPIPPEDLSPKAPDASVLNFLPGEKEVLDLVNGFRPIEEIVFLSGQGASTVYRVLLVGVVTGLLAVAVKGVRGGGEVADESLQRDLEISRRRVEAKFEQINHASYFEILGVSKGATAYEIEAAYRRLKREFDPVYFSRPDLQDLSEKLKVIRRTLDEARDVLTDDLLREGYQQSLLEGP